MPIIVGVAEFYSTRGTRYYHTYIVSIFRFCRILHSSIFCSFGISKKHTPGGILLEVSLKMYRQCLLFWRYYCLLLWRHFQLMWRCCLLLERYCLLFGRYCLLFHLGDTVSLFWRDTIYRTRRIPANISRKRRILAIVLIISFLLSAVGQIRPLVHDCCCLFPFLSLSLSLSVSPAIIPHSLVLHTLTHGYFLCSAPLIPSLFYDRGDFLGGGPRPHNSSPDPMQSANVTKHTSRYYTAHTEIALQWVIFPSYRVCIIFSYL